MFIADQLKKQSISEYLLYMWQVEDTIRAYGLDADRMDAEYIPLFKLDETKKIQLKKWYESLIQMMREEGVTEHGHLQVNTNVIIYLTDLTRNCSNQANTHSIQLPITKRFHSLWNCDERVMTARRRTR